MYVDCLFLKENARGNGTGKQIMELIKIHSKEEGCSMIQWQTPDFNTRAIKFYTVLGAERKKKEIFLESISQMISILNRDRLKSDGLYFFNYLIKLNTAYFTITVTLSLPTQTGLLHRYHYL